jgi:site-specific recombinase XerC
MRRRLPLRASSSLPRYRQPGRCTIRYRFATRAYRGSRNLRAVQVLLGHTSIATTERYTAVDDDEIRAAMLSAL